MCNSARPDGLFQDMCKKRFVYVKELKVLVLDEADVMLDQDLTVSIEVAKFSCGVVGA